MSLKKALKRKKDLELILDTATSLGEIKRGIELKNFSWGEILLRERMEYNVKMIPRGLFKTHFKREIIYLRKLIAAGLETENAAKEAQLIDSIINN